MSELLPCPFCGGDAVLDGSSDDVRVRCETGCQAIGRAFYFDSDDDDAIKKAESDAVEAWNRRTPSSDVSRLTAERDALRAENERLRKALTEAIKSVAAWGSFANEYEQDRYRLSDEIVRLSAALEATK